MKIIYWNLEFHLPSCQDRVFLLSLISAVYIPAAVFAHNDVVFRQYFIGLLGLGLILKSLVVQIAETGDFIFVPSNSEASPCKNDVGSIVGYF